ncbi:MAG TPA: serpin family protein [Chloroflexota bacterium]|nr:serpin family protein [Chloroflexota bacterium]
MDSLNLPCSRRGLMRSGLLAGAALAAAPLATRSLAFPATAQVAPMPAAALAAANLDFAFRLQGAVLGSGAPSNVLLSPLSVSIALAMVFNGAAGSTRQAMASTMSLGAMSTADLNRANASLLAGLAKRAPTVRLEIADSLWQRPNLALLPAFVSAVGNAYGAAPARLDFADPRAPGVINAWVSKHTHGLIPKIIDRIPPEMVLFLVNALYFKGPWSAPFDPHRTTPGPFTLQSGAVVKMPMMTHTSSYAYTRQPGYEAIRLPYASGQFSMYLFLPDPSSNLRAFLSGLTARSWASMITGLSSRRGTITMPKFNMNYTASLNSALSTLGMGIAFDARQANFSAMARGQQLFISDVRHATVMEVDEQGTKAAAVTSIGVGATAIEVDSFSMTVNRPFFCAIRDEATGTLLFLGTVADPR